MPMTFLTGWAVKSPQVNLHIGEYPYSCRDSAFSALWSKMDDLAPTHWRWFLDNGTWRDWMSDLCDAEWNAFYRADASSIEEVQDVSDTVLGILRPLFPRLTFNSGSDTNAFTNAPTLCCTISGNIDVIVAWYWAALLFRLCLVNGLSEDRSADGIMAYTDKIDGESWNDVADKQQHRRVWEHLYVNHQRTLSGFDLMCGASGPVTYVSRKDGLR